MNDSILACADYLASVEHGDPFGIRQQRLHAAIRAVATEVVREECKETKHPVCPNANTISERLSAFVRNNTPQDIPPTAAPSAKASEWEPTKQQKDELYLYWASRKWKNFEDFTRHILVEAHCIAKEECKCSQSGSSQESSGGSQGQQSQRSSSDTSIGANLTNGVLQSGSSGGQLGCLHSCSTTPASAPSSSSSGAPATSFTPDLNHRIEALFAANPGWRPKQDDTSLFFGGLRWSWLYQSAEQGFIPCCNPEAYLTAALLPRAVEKWWNDKIAECSFSRAITMRVFVSQDIPPTTLEDAVKVLEGK